MREGDPNGRVGTLRAALAVAAVAVLVGAPAAVAGGRFDRSADTTWVPGQAPAVAANAPDGPQDPATTSAVTSIDTALTAQAAAVANGSSITFLASVEAPLRAAMRRRFEALRAVKATDYATRLVTTPVLAGDRWRAEVEVRFCAGATGCPPAPVRIETTWIINGDGARLVEWGQSTRNGSLHSAAIATQCARSLDDRRWTDRRLPGQAHGAAHV